jgi:hypothetical protein
MHFDVAQRNNNENKPGRSMRSEMFRVAAKNSDTARVGTRDGRGLTGRIQILKKSALMETWPIYINLAILRKATSCCRFSVGMLGHVEP